MNPSKSFAIIGLSRAELGDAQLFIDVMRNCPDEMTGILRSLQEINGSRLPPAAQNIGPSDTFEIVGS
jgi:hypothetical protein